MDKEIITEELINQMVADYQYYSQELKTLRDIISNKEKRNAVLFLEVGRYRKALDEIEEYCEEQNLKYDTTACMILDIINKAKGEITNE